MTALTAAEPASDVAVARPKNRVNGFDLFSLSRVGIDVPLASDCVRDFRLDVRQTASAKAYAYVSGNPLNATDPSGLFDLNPLDAAQAAADAAARAASAAHDKATQAKNWAGDNLPNCTVFDGKCAPVIKSAEVCFGGGIYGGIGITGSTCIAEANGYQQVGMTGSAGYGLGLGGSVGPSIGISNAPTLNDFGGPFWGAGGATPWGSGELQVSPDPNSCGGTTWVASGGGPGLGGWVDATNTGVWRWR